MALDMDVVTHAAPPNSAEHSDLSWCTDLDSLGAEKTLRDVQLRPSPPAPTPPPADRAGPADRRADGGGEGDNAAAAAGGLREAVHRCCKCGAGIDGRQWFMAGNRKHCSVACSTHTALRLEEDDPTLREGTSAADLVAGIAEEEEE